VTALPPVRRLVVSFAADATWAIVQSTGRQVGQKSDFAVGRLEDAATSTIGPPRRLWECRLAWQTRSTWWLRSSGLSGRRLIRQGLRQIASDLRDPVLAPFVTAVPITGMVLSLALAACAVVVLASITIFILAIATRTVAAPVHHQFMAVAQVATENALNGEFTMTVPLPSCPVGISHHASSLTVEETLQRVEQVVRDRGLALFAHFDHSSEAARVDLSMAPAHVLVFGNPRAGTPLMLASPLIALDLPLKVLVWQDASGQVWVSHAEGAWLARRYRLPDALPAVVEKPAYAGKTNRSAALAARPSDCISE
jgi:uncharacterized protein (DUF302 family)